MVTLTRCEPTIPSSWYYDPEHYACELPAIWYRDWVCVGRLEETPATGDYQLVGIGDQELIATRDEGNKPRVFHNTCRHRGSLLCQHTAKR
jgi:Rieske 2Fe-2S family protein